MARIFENQCVGCTSIGLSCIGGSCPNQRVEILVCDMCNEDYETLYEFEGAEYCEGCLIEHLKTEKVIEEVV